MDQLSRQHYELVYERNFLKFKGNEFQDFFSSLMEKCYPGDFQRIRPWGKFGDRKNDGYLKSQRTLFQIYAPNEMKSAEAVAKINEDFYGALHIGKSILINGFLFIIRKTGLDQAWKKDYLS